MPFERAFSNLGAKVGDLESAWRDRLIDAEHLMNADRYSTAISMGLYALEILLKSRICLRLDLRQLPKPFEIHDLSGLLVLSGHSRSINKKIARRVKTNWVQVEKMSRELLKLRYQPNTMKTRQMAEDFFAQLKAEPDGVIPWISSQS